MREYTAWLKSSLESAAFATPVTRDQMLAYKECFRQIASGITSGMICLPGCIPDSLVSNSFEPDQVDAENHWRAYYATTDCDNPCLSALCCRILFVNNDCSYDSDEIRTHLEVTKRLGSVLLPHLEYHTQQHEYADLRHAVIVKVVFERVYQTFVRSAALRPIYA